VLTWTHSRGELRAGHDVAYLAADVSVHRAADRRAEALQQGADAAQALARQQVGGLISVAGHVEMAGDLVRDLVGQGGLDRRIVDERLDVGYVAVGVGDLVGAPDGQHG
jgi:hypothetical protein